MYENIVLRGNFIMPTANPGLKKFMSSFDLDNLIGSPIIPTSIALILTNKENHIVNSAAFETDLSDHHKLTTTILRNT